MTHLLMLASVAGGQTAHGPTLSALAFGQVWAEKTGGVFSLLLLAADGLGEASEFEPFGAERIATVSRTEFLHPQAETVAAVCHRVMEKLGADCLAGGLDTFGRDCLPRAAGLLGLPMVSDVMRLQREDTDLLCERPAHAGRYRETVRMSGPCVFGVRASSFGPPQRKDRRSPVERLAVDVPPGRAVFLSSAVPEHTRPALDEARVVVAGGRSLRDKASWERLVGGLADALGGAVGATGGAVGAGLADSDALIGQTGETVAPDLYIGAGVSGSDQHVAGMRDSKIIVAINADPQATLFKFADYGLVADVHQALPELIEKVKRVR